MSAAASPDPHAARRVEIVALCVAIIRQQSRIDTDRANLRRMEEKLAAQEAELRFQRLILRPPYAPRHKQP